MTEKRKNLLLGILLISVFPLARVIHPYMTPSDFTVCAFRTITGKPCPFCGLTRAFSHAAHGDFSAAFGFNMFWWLAALLTAGVGIVALADGVSGNDRLKRLRCATAFADAYIIVFLVLFTIYRCV